MKLRAAESFFDGIVERERDDYCEQRREYGADHSGAGGYKSRQHRAARVWRTGYVKLDDGICKIADGVAYKRHDAAHKAGDEVCLLAVSAFAVAVGYFADREACQKFYDNGPRRSHGIAVQKIEKSHSDAACDTAGERPHQHGREKAGGAAEVDHGGA